MNYIFFVLNGSTFVWQLGSSATRRRQCSLLFSFFLFLLTTHLLPSSFSHHPSLSLPLYAVVSLVFFPFSFPVSISASLAQISPVLFLTLSHLVFHLPLRFESLLPWFLRCFSSFSSFLCILSLSRWRTERSVRVCQCRRGAPNLKAHLSPWMSPLPPPNLNHLWNCDLSPFTLPPKQTGHDPPRQSRSHSTLRTRCRWEPVSQNCFNCQRRAAGLRTEFPKMWYIWKLSNRHSNFK